MNKLAKVICEGCGRQFYRVKSEVKRNKNKGLRVFCSLSCKAKHANNGRGDVSRFNGKIGVGRDEFSPFRDHFNRIKRRGKKCNVTLKYLKKVWDSQSGICLLSGISMYLAATTAHYNKEKLTPNFASIDRIDSSKGYIKGNIRFVTVMANLCKNKFSDEDVINFCNKVVEFNKS